jgi:hypothetical protein
MWWQGDVGGDFKKNYKNSVKNCVGISSCVALLLLL